MGLKFNPLTAQFDLTGSGGGASYIDGEVATYNDLPLSSTTAPLNTAWLVRGASGVWPVSRKQAGIYIRTATAGSSRDADYTYAGTMPDVFSDAVLTIYDEAATTRTGQFNLGSITAGQNRVLTWPDGNGTIARTSDIPSTFAASAITSGVFDNARINFAAPSAIGSTTAAAITGTTGTFTTLSANNGTLTASAPVLDLSQTWNNAAVTFTALQQTITNTASANGSRLFNFVVGSTSALSARTMTGVVPTEALAINGGDRGLAFGSNTVTNPANAFFSLRWQSNVAGFNSSAILAWGSDVYNLNYDLAVQREAADTFAQRRGSNAQTFRLYNTYTDASNYERGFMRWSSNVLQIGTEKLGTGSARALEFQTDGSTRLTITTGGSIIHGVGTGVIGWNASTILRPLSGDGTLVLYNNAQSDFGRLQFGGTTSSFPALKRSSTTLQVRLADDSAYSVLDAQLRAQGTAPATSGATGTAGDIRYDADYIYVCTAANTWKRAAIATW